MGRIPEESIIERYGSTEAYKEYLHKRLSGKHFYTNGVEDRKFGDDEEIPEGWYRGRTNSGRSTKGYHFINNGVSQTLVPSDSVIPDGWTLGTLPFTEEHKEKISKSLSGYEHTEEHNSHLRESHRTEEYLNNFKSTIQERYGVDNPFQSEEVREKIRQTNLERYGVNHPSQAQEIKDKIVQSTLENHGVEYPMQSDTVKSKSRSTSLDRYGTESPMQSDVVKDKRKKTSLEKYGVEYPSQSKEVRDKIRQTCLDRYGTESPFQSDITKSKRKQTSMERYGSEHPLGDSEILEKQIKTNLERHGVMYNIQLPQSNVGSNDSTPNREFAELLGSLNISYDREFPVKNYKFDFKVGDKLIEVDPFATHNTLWNPFGDKRGIDKDYHKNKSRIAESCGYQVIHVFDWDDKSKVVNSLLVSKDRVYARDTKVCGIDKRETKEFLIENHLQGSCNGQTVCLGLRDRYGELISLMTFGKPRYNKNYEYELLRYCSSYNVIGGAEKLFKHFVRQYNPESIISYCDRSKFRGDVYHRLGFTLKTEGNPSKHWYNRSYERLPHITDNLLRQRGFDQLFNENYGKGTSNEELIIKMGFVSIYDCGQDSYEWRANVK